MGHFSTIRYPSAQGAIRLDNVHSPLGEQIPELESGHQRLSSSDPDVHVLAQPLELTHILFQSMGKDWLFHPEHIVVLKDLSHFHSGPKGVGHIRVYHELNLIADSCPSRLDNFNIFFYTHTNSELYGLEALFHELLTLPGDDVRFFEARSSIGLDTARMTTQYFVDGLFAGLPYKIP